jgi:protein tyrosine phosphatase (PTP) superfamily phosphohydrolase (DUF442 family)
MLISEITDYLYVTRRQKAKDIEEVSQLDIQLIIDMIFHMRPPRELEVVDIDVLWLPSVDFVLIPIPLKLLERGVNAALPVIKDGGRVLVYCIQGRHRSIAMACCILIAMGYSADEAMELVKEKRGKADPDAWHIQRQIRRFEVYWKDKSYTSS